MSIYDKAISLIKIRPHFSVELARKLSLRGFKSEDIKNVINQLRDQGMLNDDQFAQMYLDELIRNKTFGFYGLKAKMMQRGIEGSEAERLLKEKLSYELERELALKILDKSANLPKQKIAQRLSSKGFRSDTIRSVLQDFC